MRIGHGYDIHRFETEITKNHLMLAGVAIPYERGLLAHSDGDVVIHAVCDALLGACALGDIGQHFPDTDPQYRNIQSALLLQNVLQKMYAKNYTIANLDITIIAQVPRLAPYISVMQETLAQLLAIPVQDVNLKATTHEGLDAIGNKQAIAVHAVVLLN